MRAIFTIGHSTHPIDKFLALLKQHQVEAVADVRSSPYSRRNPQYNRENLKNSLAGAQIHYVFLGRELGARTRDPACYVDGKVQYDHLAQTELFKSGIKRVLEGAKSYRVALMCAEQDPLNCHRTLLVARALDKQEMPVRHILPDGGLVTHGEVMDKLIGELGLSGEDLFLGREEIKELAYAGGGGGRKRDPTGPSISDHGACDGTYSRVYCLQFCLLGRT